MELLLEKINSSEQKWLRPLYKHSKSLFEKTHLPSHDAEHHLRVWLHCRGLMIELHKAGIKSTHDNVDKAIIACFFHDAGLTQDIGEQHGFLGRKICEEYFKDDPYFQSHDMNDVLQAIELHDDKSKKGVAEATPYTMKTIVKLISASDDLDALGYIGVFRYIEIYLKRGVPDNEIPKKVITNLRNRFSNFLNTYSDLQKFTEKQKLRFKETYDFFTELDSQMAHITATTNNQLEVFNILKENLVVNKQGINETIENVLSTTIKDYSLWYFSKLRNELEVTSALLLE